MNDEQPDPADVEEIEEKAAEVDARDPDAAEDIAELVEDADLSEVGPPPDVDLDN